MCIRDRRWDRDIFLHSLGKAEATDPATLESGGNRAVIYCSTTDPYQTFRGQKSEDGEQRENQLHHEARGMVRESLELIRDYSTPVSYTHLRAHETPEHL